MSTAETIRSEDLLRAELTKIRTLPATWIALIIACIAHTLLGLLAATDLVRMAGRDGPTAIGQLDTLMVSPVYALVALAVFAAGTEYRAGQLRVSLAAVPDRRRLFAAKLAAVAGVGIVAAIPAALPGYLVRHASALVDGHLGIDRAVIDLAAFSCAHLLLGLLGWGFGIVAKGVVVPLAVLGSMPVLISPRLRGAVPELVRFLPHEATLSLLDMADDRTMSLDRAGGLLVLGSWTVLFIGAAWALFARRDS